MDVNVTPPYDGRMTAEPRVETGEAAPRLAFDPIAAAREQWVGQGWAAAADGMAAVTSLMRAHQIVLARVEAIVARGRAPVPVAELCEGLCNPDLGGRLLRELVEAEQLRVEVLGVGATGLLVALGDDLVPRRTDAVRRHRPRAHRADHVGPGRESDVVAGRHRRTKEGQQGQQGRQSSAVRSGRRPALPGPEPEASQARRSWAGSSARPSRRLPGPPGPPEPQGRRRQAVPGRVRALRTDCRGRQGRRVQPRVQPRVQRARRRECRPGRRARPGRRPNCQQGS